MAIGSSTGLFWTIGASIAPPACVSLKIYFGSGICIFELLRARILAPERGRGRSRSMRSIDIPMLEREGSVVERSLRPFFRSNTHGTVR
jgi:hypothetical protein